MSALPMLPEDDSQDLYIISMIHASLESIFKEEFRGKVVTQQGHNYSKLASQSTGKIFGDYSPWQIYQTFEANEAVKTNNLSALIELSWNCHETNVFDNHKCKLYVGRLCRELRCSTYSALKKLLTRDEILTKWQNFQPRMELFSTDCIFYKN